MDINDNIQAGRLEAEFDEGVSELHYKVQGDRLVVTYVEVPPELGGQGVGGKMVAAAVDKARDENLELVPVCPFARAWLQRNPDATHDVDVVPV